MGSSDEAEIQRLLTQLDSEDPFLRRQAAEAALAHEPRDERVLDKLKTVAVDDPDPAVRSAAAQALRSAGVEPPPEPVQKPEAPAPPAEPIPRAVKWRGFLIGFAGWFLVNGLLWFLASRGGYEGNLMVLVWLANPLLLLILAIIKPTRRVALGMLSALALNLLIALARNMVFNAMCGLPFWIDFSGIL